MSDGYEDMSLLELFRIETEGQAQALTAGLLALERDPTAANELEVCMRAAHSLKGAARIVDLPTATEVAHVMEDCFVEAQKGRLILAQAHIDVLLRGVDLLVRMGGAEEGKRDAVDAEVPALLADLRAAMASPTGPVVPKFVAPVSVVAPAAAATPAQGERRSPDEAKEVAPGSEVKDEAADRVLRVTAENLNRLLALAGESLVESRWVKTYAGSLLRLKRMQGDVNRTLGRLVEQVPAAALNDTTRQLQVELQQQVQACQQHLAERLSELDMFDRRSVHLSHRLYDEALSVRMRPFADGGHGLARLVRDVARSLGKQARLEIVGEDTQVDRDILEKLEAPLGHLVRNAVDHGIEDPAVRVAAGKPAEGVIRLEARHSAGMLQISVSDDGRGIDPEQLRERVVVRQLTDATTAQKLTESELLEFLFLPGFSLRDTVTQISGRGVGLDVVQTMVKQVRGTVRATGRPGDGSRFQMLLPLTLSVVRTLLVEIAGEPYAFPLAHIVRTLRLPADRIELLEGRQHFELSGHRIGLVAAEQVLAGRGGRAVAPDQAVVVVGDLSTRAFGLVVDRFLGERELVVQALDRRLGKIKDIAAGALMEDGSPVLIFDVEDLILSMEKLIAAGRVERVQASAVGAAGERRQRVLVVDDSLTVRELERKLLSARGYLVEVAVDGMEGWNTVRTGRFDLVVTDVDMPRMDGIELVTMIKRDTKLQGLPVMIVSYKDREEDRRRGLEAGADYYLTKSSFQGDTLVQAVAELIGEART